MPGRLPAEVNPRSWGQDKGAAGRLYWVAFGAILLAGVFLRFYMLNTLPVGFHHDDALDGLTALGILKGNFAIFFNNYNPREPLMIYFQSIGEFLFGPTRLGASSMPAVFGVTEIVLTWLLTREMFGRRVALLAAAFTAVSFWHMFVSRLSERAISQPLVEMLCLYFFWRTLARRRWRDAIPAGVFLGLVLYTYTAARAVPILLLLMVLWQLATVPRFWRALGQMFTIAGVGLVVFLPLGIHFLQHPGDFYGRSLEVNVVAPERFTASGGAGGVGTAVLNTLGMFSIRGDNTWKYNLSGQPVFDWPLSALFYAGIVLAVVGVAAYLRRRRATRAPADAYAFVLIWMFAMLIPGFISSESPHFLRTIGIVPAVFVLPALTVSWLASRWRWVLPLAGVLVAAEGAETYVHYFHDWAHNPAAYYANQGNVADAAEYLKTVPASVPILFSTEYPNHPTVLYLAPKVFPRVRWFDGRSSIVFPPAGQKALYVYPVDYAPLWTNLSTYFTPQQLVHEGRDPAGQVSYRVYESSMPPAQARPLQPLSANLDGLAELSGTALPSTVQAGQAFKVLEYWRVTRNAQAGLRAFVHLVDAQGHQWAQADNLGFYSEDWRPGDIGVNVQTLAVPATAPPVPMTVEFGLYLPATGQQMPFLDAHGAPTSTQLSLGTVHIEPANPPATSQPALPNATSKPVAPGLTLAGWKLGAGSVQAGASLPVTLYWHVTAPPASVPPLKLGSLAMVDRGLADMLPLTRWPLGAVIADRHDVEVAPTASAGQVELTVAGIPLGMVQVTEPPRQYTLPAVQHRVGEAVGSFATLVGYDVDKPRPGGVLHLTLVWQARATTSTSYKVFTHVLDRANHVIAQQDSLPAAGAMPTTFWVPKQVIVDRYALPLPATLPAQLRLELGMYEPTSGQRLPIGTQQQLILPLAR
ncbi:MAG TPA: glycosyltransferase family 39 protein [Chloroflexota bacterium]|nr:glycosyltransferase family 39 protein [Chloroflexota bacterium]